MVRFGELCTFGVVLNIRVSIPVWCDLEKALILACMVFISVSIPVWCDLESSFQAAHSLRKLVSIPVWCDLENKTCFVLSVVVMFQFQYGAIWRPINQADPFDLTKFQFQYGAIWRKPNQGKAVKN